MNTTRSKSDASFADRQKSNMLLQMYILTWILLVAATMGLKFLNLGGVYVFSAWNAFSLLGCAVGLIEEISHASKISFTGKESRSSAEISPTSNSSELAETSPPLEKSAQAVPQSSQTVNLDERSSFGWWIIQLLLVIPVPITLLTHILLLLVDSLSQTLSDGNNPVIGSSTLTLLSGFAWLTRCCESQFMVLWASCRSCLSFR
jgi:hypothetical protein